MWCYISRKVEEIITDLIVLILIIVAVVGALDALAIVNRKYKK